MAKQWFIRTGPSAKSRNTVVPLVDGLAAWQEGVKMMNSAKSTIHLAFWMMNLNMELERPTHLTFKGRSARKPHTLRALLLRKVKQGVKVRILLWMPGTGPKTTAEMFGKPEGSVLDTFIGPTVIPLRKFISRATIAGVIDRRLIKDALAGNFEVLLEPHPKLIGSWHQKTIIVDEEHVLMGGMNMKENDWDDPSHKIYDYRRMAHGQSAMWRKRRKRRHEKPDFVTRHDLMAKVNGAISFDVADNFALRWNQAIKDGRFLSERATRIPGSHTLSTRSKSPKNAQIVRTMPKGYKPLPRGETGCFQAYVKAIRNAEHFIYIEDQYFRSQPLAKELAKALTKNPSLVLIVVTMPDQIAEFDLGPVKGIASPSTKWTAKAVDIIRKVQPDFSLFTLKVSDIDRKGKRIYDIVNIHAKIMIVDDQWYTIGSCNVNDRGFFLDGEINVTVHDPGAAYALRSQLWEEHLGVASAPRSSKASAKLWFKHAAENHKAEKAGKKPLSRIYAFNQHGPLLPMAPSKWI